ncbi:MAG: hypothetical protein UV19_C0021G0006 [Parcubacteria group bacterium GW2011_GWA2_42_28]|nr:MAG: hypothetical protein UV19_C0021G0006 [Parcubacteria group bacterium GW2011_GWA2_42_28]
MNTAVVSKTDFIKFNVSPTFKALAQKKAATHGMSLSELGRMLFGMFVTEITTPQVPKALIRMAEKAREDHRKGKTKSFTNTDEMMAYLDSI